MTPDQIMSQFRAVDHDVLTEVVMKIGFEQARAPLAPPSARRPPRPRGRAALRACPARAPAARPAAAPPPPSPRFLPPVAGAARGASKPEHR